ncbi:MAG: PAS domain-containing protein [Anaerolineales bacterium]|nr:PAS domain-containing protein [Anaerolineales bacterium]
MPRSTPPAYSLSSLFKPDPFRDFFRVLADSLDSSVVVLSGDGRRMLASNHAFTLITGFSRSELEDMKFTRLLAGDGGERAMGQILLAWDNPETSLKDVPLLTREGTITLIDIDVRSIGSLGTALLLLCTPARTRMRWEEERLARDEQLNTLVRLSSMLLEELEEPLHDILRTAKPLLSAATLGLYRVSPHSPDYIREGDFPLDFPETLPTTAIEPLKPATIWSLGHRTEHDLQRAARSSGLSTLRTAPLGSAEAWIGVLVAGWREPDDMPDQAEGWMEFTANLCHTLILRHLLRLQVNELELVNRQLQAELGDQFSAVDDGLLALDENFIVVRVNPAAARMLGYHPAELPGLSIRDVLVGAKDVNATLLDALGHDREAEQSQLTLHRRDGTPFPVHLRVVPFSHDYPSRLLVILQDQSERQAYEDQTEVLAQRALLGDVTAILAHEVRNPINNISTGVQLVASRLGVDHPQYDNLDKLKRECDRLNQLLSDVLFFARPLELKMEPLDLPAMLNRLLTRWNPRLNQAKVKFIANFSDELPYAFADPRTLEQVFVNLISNALQAMPDGGTISCTIHEITSAQGPMLEITIADTGVGIPEDKIERIFDPFFTTKKEGTGLGLAISRRILSAHKGAISVKSYTNAGTAFTILVPAVEASN